MTEKFHVVCKSCNNELGVHDTPKFEQPKECPICGSDKIGVAKFDSDETEELTFEISIFNKKTGASRTAGFLISKDTVKRHGKDLNEMRKIMATETAKSLHDIIKSDVLLVDLIRTGGD